MYPIENSGNLIKNKRRQLFSREIWTNVGGNVFFLGLTSLVTDISSEMVTATLPLYLLLALRLAPLQFGLIDGINQGASVLVRIASGLIADRWRRAKEVATAGYAFSAICRIGLLLVGRSWLGLSGVVLLDRIGKGIRTAPRDAMIAASVPSEKLGTAFGIHRAMDTAGAMLGPLVAAGLLLLAPGSYDVVFVVSFCIAIVGVAVIALAWFGIRSGQKWAMWTAFITPVIGVAIALPLHFVYGIGTLGHLGLIYLDAVIPLVGTVLSYRALGSSS